MCNDQDNLLLAVFFKGRKYIALKLSALKFFSYYKYSTCLHIEKLRQENKSFAISIPRTLNVLV